MTEMMDVLNPATEETIATVPRGTAEDVDAAVAAAKAALPEWLETTPGERAEVLLGLARACSRRTPRSSRGSSRATSASRSPMRATRFRCASTTSASSPGAARVLEGKSAGEYMRGYTSMIRREPLGVVGGIAPWNYPLMMAVWKLAPPSRPATRRC